MEHLSKDILKLYMNHELDVEEQERTESHLYDCDDCLNVYLALIESQTLKHSVSDDFTDQTVSKIYSQTKSHQKSKKPYSSKNRKLITHYFLAAGLTIVLMLTGIFQTVLDVTNDYQVETSTSITDQLMQKTNTLLDYMKGDHKQ
ncbi:zf-HC2 domain-containing protein [Gracilibacillus sp. YIM 98692]|uniref:zf-HC2 domain-containing protein n=1 Tax=Gracilibacillus sp. YIM 98692 TaxID=2663532 RepID=UPI0013CF733F|nr:zf-HC2 domain-containing protein [Gracilibacillus sp. YIM 98692]